MTSRLLTDEERKLFNASETDIATIEWLLGFGEENPASLTMLALLILRKWRASGDTRLLEIGKQYLEDAARQGDPEANYQLATFCIKGETRGNAGRKPREYLIGDERGREQYLGRARRAGHVLAQHEFKPREERSCDKSFAHEEWEKERSGDDLKQIEKLRSDAHGGDSEVQLELANKLVQVFWDCAFGRIEHADPHSLLKEAEGLLRSAATELPEARYQLVAHNFEKDEDASLELLRLAAYPLGNEDPYPNALLDLSKRYIAKCQFREAEKCLRDAIALGIRAEAHLADLIYEHHAEIGAELKDACHLYESVLSQLIGANRNRAAFRAGLFYLRGENCPKDLQKAKEYFKAGASSRTDDEFQESDELRLAGMPKDWMDNHELAPFYCQLAFTLGWGGHAIEDGSRMLLQRLIAAHFQPEEHPYLHRKDVMFLIKTWCLQHIQTGSDLAGSAQWIEDRIRPAQGMIQLLTEITFDKRDAERFFGNEDANAPPFGYEKLLIWGWLHASERIPHADLAMAKQHFEALRKSLIKDRRILKAEEDGLAVKPGRYDWLRHQVDVGLRFCAEKEAAWQQANAAVREIQHKLDVERAKEQTQKDMLSYLTHTLNNTFAGRPEAARQAMRILGSELYENNAGYTAINNIASMMSTFLFAQQLVSTFKVYVADPEALRKNWETDREGDASITTVLAMSVRQTLSQIVFSSNQLSTLNRLLLNKGGDAIKNARKSFMDEMIPLDVSAANAHRVFDWVRDHIGIMHITIDPAAELHFHSNSTRFTFFFSGFSELVFNALKYSDAAQPIEIIWEKSGGAYVFRCENAWSEDSISRRQGSDKGLLFLDRLTRMLRASLEKRIEGNRFIAEIRFPENLFKEAS
jgi:TPR repeat protein